LHPYLPFIFAGLIFFIAHFVAGVTGFGSGILGLPLLAMIVGLDAGKQSLLILSTLLYIYMVARWHAHIDVRRLIIMAVVASIGIPFGLFLYGHLQRHVALITLGAFVALVGFRNLLQLWPDQKLPRCLASILLVVGGIFHGAFTTGGPILIIYADQTLRHKSTFRATLCLLWISLNAILAIVWTMQHAWLRQTWHLSLLGLPFMIAGLIIGERIHHAIDERTFRRAVNIALIVIGVLLIVHPAG